MLICMLLEGGNNLKIGIFMPKLIKLKNDVYLANEIYSNKEIKIGKWVDEKTDVYRKVVVGSKVLGGGNYQVPHGILNFGLLTNSELVFFDAALGAYRKLNFSYNNGASDSTWYGGYGINGADIIFQVGSSMASVITYWHCIIEYTKTTD